MKNATVRLGRNLNFPRVKRSADEIPRKTRREIYIRIIPNRFVPTRDSRMLEQTLCYDLIVFGTYLLDLAVLAGRFRRFPGIRDGYFGRVVTETIGTFFADGFDHAVYQGAGELSQFRVDVGVRLVFLRSLTDGERQRRRSDLFLEGKYFPGFTLNGLN